MTSTWSQDPFSKTHSHMFTVSLHLYMVPCTIVDAKMFAAVLRIDDQPTDHSKSCCHVRFFNEEIIPNYPNFFESPTNIVPTVINNKMLNAIRSVDLAVVHLRSHSSFHRFSIISRDQRSCALVRLQENRCFLHVGSMQSCSWPHTKTGRY